MPGSSRLATAFSCVAGKEGIKLIGHDRNVDMNK
jgi:hypothetical protein